MVAGRAISKSSEKHCRTVSTPPSSSAVSMEEASLAQTLWPETASIQ